MEFYGRVCYSRREGNCQYIQLGDLYHSRPPFINATYDSFSLSKIWDEDSAAILLDKGKGMVVRVVGKVGKIMPSTPVDPVGSLNLPVYTISVIHVREADWDEIEELKEVLGGMKL